MDRRHSAEAGFIQPTESYKLLDAAEDLMHEGKIMEGSEKLKQSIEADPHNTDSILALANFTPFDPMRRKMLSQALKIAEENLKKSLGPNCFEKYKGEFWLTMETRPYMRVLQATHEHAVGNDDPPNYSKACKIAERMLTLCPNDNMSVRSALPAYLFGAGRYLDCVNFCFEYVTNMVPDKYRPADPVAFSTFSSTVPVFTRRQLDAKENCANTSMLYMAALSCYALKMKAERSGGRSPYGDQTHLENVATLLFCEGAKRNPIIATRLIKHEPKPEDYCHHPREMDGPEDAQDFLYIAQDCFEKTRGGVKFLEKATFPVLLRYCGRPHCSAHEKKLGGFKHCSGCKSVVYCSVECQKMHWADHAEDCKRIRQKNFYLSKMH